MPAPNSFVTARLTFRTGTTAEWMASDPVLRASEPAWDNTIRSLKIGDGTSRWSELNYLATDSRTILVDSESENGFKHDGSIIPSTINTITGGVVYSAAELKAINETGPDNFTAGLDGTTPKVMLNLTAGTGGFAGIAGNVKIFNHDAEANITATPMTGYVFDEWIGDVADPNSSSTTVLMDDHKYVRGQFRLQ